MRFHWLTFYHETTRTDVQLGIENEKEKNWELENAGSDEFCVSKSDEAHKMASCK